MSTTNIRTELRKLEHLDSLSFKFIQVRNHGIVWELDNPYGFNLFIVSMYLFRIFKNSSDVNVVIPSIIDLKKGTQFPIDPSVNVTEVGEGNISKVPNGTCIIFDNMREAIIFGQKACGDVLVDSRISDHKLYTSSTIFKIS